MVDTSRQLSPARQALQDHFVECNNLSERIAILSQPIRAYEDAVVEERRCVESLEAVAELEMAAWDRWTKAPNGTPPCPLIEERAAAASYLAEAAEYREQLKTGVRAGSPPSRRIARETGLNRGSLIKT